MEKIRVKMLTTVVPDIGFCTDLNRIASASHEYDAVSNAYGAIAVICKNGKLLGVRPGEFEFIEAPERIFNIHKNLKTV